MNKPLMVVFEGPECVGKTSIINRLTEEFPSPISKRVRTPDVYSRLSEIFRDIDQQVIRTSCGSGERLVLFDRWQLVSDVVYERYCYNTPSIFEPLYQVLARKCKQSNILFIYLDVSEEEMLRRFDVRGDALRTRDEAILVRNKYEEFFNGEFGGLLPFERIDTTDKTTDVVYDLVKYWISWYGEFNV